MKLLLDENLSDRVLPRMLDPYPDFLRVGNCPTSRITQLLRPEFAVMSAFDADPNTAILILS